MTYHLTVTHAAFRQIVAGLTTNPARVAMCPAGLSHLPSRTEWLVHAVRWHPLAAGNSLPRVLVVGTGNAAQLHIALRAALPHGSSEGMSLLIAVGISTAAGNIAGICHTPHDFEPLQAITIVGAGLPRIFLPATAPDHSPASSLTSILSRTIGALGERTWHRLASLHVGIIGCGRTGSLVATALTRLGVQSLLVDPDVLEEHNLGEMDGVTPSDLGRTKVAALADSLRARSSHTAQHLAAVPDSILSLSALVAVKHADLLICCVDNAPARVATAFLAALYLKPLLDLGSGIFFEVGAPPSRPSNQQPEIRHRTMGADIRLVLPGRCLLCFGGVANLDQARAELLNRAAIHQPGQSGQRSQLTTPPLVPPDWRQQRAGSLRSLNTIAVGLALRLLEDLVGGHIAESVGLRLEFNNMGIPTLEHRIPPLNPHCPLCALHGHGDEGIQEVSAVLRGL